MNEQNDLITNTHRVVAPFNTGKVQIGRSYTPRVTPQQANCIEYQAAPGLLASAWFWVGGSILSIGVWTLIWAAVAFLLEVVR